MEKDIIFPSYPRTFFPSSLVKVSIDLCFLSQKIFPLVRKSRKPGKKRPLQLFSVFFTCFFRMYYHRGSERENPFAKSRRENIGKGGLRNMKRNGCSRGSIALLVLGGVVLLGLGVGGTWFLMDERSEGFRREMEKAQVWMKDSLKDAEGELEDAKEDLRNMAAELSRKKREWQRALEVKAEEAGNMIDDLRSKLKDATEKGREAQEELKQEYEAKLASLKEGYAEKEKALQETLASFEEKAAAARQRLAENYEMQMTALKEDLTARFQSEKTRMENLLEQQRQEFLAEKEELEARFLAEEESLYQDTNRMLEENRKKMQALIQEKEEELQALRQKLQEMEAASEDVSF